MFKYLALVVSLALMACGTVEQTFRCESNADCADHTGRTFCDVNGELEASGGIAGTCVPEPPPPPPESKLALRVTAEPSVVRVGSTLALNVAITRENIAGPVEVALHEPPMGISADKVTIDAGNDVGVLMAQVAPTAAAENVDLTIHAVAGSALAAATFRVSVIGAPMTLDQTFGTLGTVTLDVEPDRPDAPLGAVVQGTSLIIVYHHGIVTRLREDGAVDTTFGVNGYTRLDVTPLGLSSPEITAFAQTADGKLVLAGAADVSNAQEDSDAFIVRLTRDGQIDPSMSPRIVAQLPGQQSVGSVVPKPDGSVLVVGNEGRVPCDAPSRLWLVSERGIGSPVDSPHRSCAAVLQSGGALVMNNESGFARLSDRLNSDPSFGNGGAAIVPGGLDTLYLGQSGIENSLLAVGWSRRQLRLWRLDGNGILDSNFGHSGYVDLYMGDWPVAVAMTQHEDGSIAVAASNDDYDNVYTQVYRVDADGSWADGYQDVGYLQAGGWQVTATGSARLPAAFVDRHRVVFISGDDTALTTTVRRFWY